MNKLRHKLTHFTLITLLVVQNLIYPWISILPAPPPAYAEESPPQEATISAETPAPSPLEPLLNLDDIFPSTNSAETIPPEAIPEATPSATPEPIPEASASATPTPDLEPPSNSSNETPTPLASPSDSPVQSVVEPIIAPPSIDPFAINISYPFNGSYPISYRFGEESDSNYVSFMQSLFKVDAHDGLDYTMPEGTEILSTDEGIVISAGSGLYGITIVIEHSWGLSYYGHLSSTSVQANNLVKRGSLIGLSGDTGISTGPHLHFGIKPHKSNLLNGFHGMVDPLPYLSKVLGASTINYKGEKSSLYILNRKTYSGSAKSISIQLLQDDLPVKYELRDPQGSVQEIKPEIRDYGTGKTAVIDQPNPFMAGMYRLTVFSADGSYDEQQFAWGVLAINPNQSEYLVGEEPTIAMAVLDNHGEMVCDAEVDLQITTPDGSTISRTTKNGSISVNTTTCASKELTLSPDYSTRLTAEQVGTYSMVLKATTKAGTFELNDYFRVVQSADFTLERITATRIYPGNVYPVIFKVKSYKDTTTSLKELVPKDFTVTPLTTDKIKEWTPSRDENAIIIEGAAPNWNLNLSSGKTYYFGYEYDAPDVSPAFYTLGPATIGSWSETRPWQIAVDAINPVVGFISPPNTWTAVGDTDINLPYPDPRNGDLLLAAVAVRPSSVTFTTPSGWTLIESRTGTDGGAEGVDTGSVALYIYSKTADGTEGSSTQTFTKSGTASVIMGHILHARSSTGTYSVSAAGVSVNGDATAWSGTLSSDIGLTNGDVVLIFGAQNGDLAGSSSWNITATNVNLKGTVNEHSEFNNATGNDIEVGLASTIIWDGTNTTTPTVNVTQSVAASGLLSAVRIRQGAGTPRTDTWLRSAGKQVTGTTSVAPTIPEHDPGDLLVMTIGSRASTDPTPSTPAGWTSLGTYNGGAGAFGVDIGPARVTAFYVQAEDRYTGSVTSNIASGNTAIGQIIAIHRAGIGSWDIDVDGGTDTTGGTSWSVTGSGIDLSSSNGGDLILMASSINSDAYSYSTHGLSATGITFGDVTETGQFTTTGGNDMAITLATGRITAGSGSGVAPTYTMTSSGSAASAPTGSTIFIKINGNSQTTPTSTVGYFSPPTSWVTAGDANLALRQPDPRNGDLMIATISIRPSASTVNTPAGWTLLDSRTGTDGAAEGIDTGSVTLYTFYKVADGTEGITNVTFTETGTTSVWLGNISKARSATGTYSLSAGGISFNGDTTAWTGTLDADIGMTQGDLILLTAATNGDLSNYNAGTWGIGAPGVTLKSTTYEQGEFPSTQGNDAEIGMASTLVWEGTNTATPSISTTLTGAASGAFTAIRIRQGSGTARTDTWMRSAGIQISGTTSVALPYPEHDVDDLLVMMVATRGSADPTPDTPNGWTSLGTYNGGAGTFGVDVGPARITTFYREVEQRMFSTVTVNITGGDTVIGQITAIHKDNLDTWSFDTDGGTDTTADTSWSVTGSGIDLASSSGGDVVLVGSSINTDAYTYTAHALSASGITFGETTQASYFSATAGNDVALDISFSRVTAGSATGVAPTFTMTSSGTATSRPTGSSIFVRILGIETASTISVEGTANGNDTATVKVAINNSVQAQTATIGSGTWTITGITTPATNDIITVWVDGVADASETSAVTKYDSGNISAMVLNTNTLSLGSNQNTSLTITNLTQYSCADDEDVMHSTVSSDLKVQGETCAGSVNNSYSAEKLDILSGNTLVADAAEVITTYDLSIAGTLSSSGAATFNVAHDWSNTGTFTSNVSTVNFTGADSSTQTVSGSTSFYNLLISTSSNSAGRTITFTAGTTQTVTNNWTVTGASSKVITLQSSSAASWTINPTNPSVTYASISYSTNTGTSFCANFSTNGGNNTGWTISDTSICPSPTSYSYQRKTWHDGTRFWRSYLDTANSRIRFDYSTDGTSWTENTSAQINTNTQDFSVEADSSTAYIAYKTADVANTDNLVTDSNLEGYWKMNEASWNGSAGEVIDSSGNSLNGARTGNATTATGKFGNGGTFDGNGDYVTVGNNASLIPGDSSWTMSAWINPTNIDQIGVVIGKFNISSGEGYGITVSNAAGSGVGKRITVAYQSATGGDSRIAATDSDVVDGNWHHVAAVLNKPNDSLTIYVDGVAVSSTNTPSGSWPVVDNTDNLIMGSLGPLYHYNGLTDDARVYSKALTEREVASLAQPGYDIEVRKAASYPATGFTWDAEDVALNGNSSTNYYQYPTITKDSGSKLWIGSTHKNSTTYTYETTRSTSASDTTLWDALSSLDSSSNSNKYGVVVPRTSSSIFAVWADGTALESKNYNGTSWDGSPTSVDTGPGLMEKSFSAVADSSGDVYLVYVDDESTDQISHKKWNGTSWSSASLVPNAASNDDAYPSLSLDNTNSKLYAFWIDTSTGYISYSTCLISTNCDAASEWTNESSWQLTGTNTSISSNYSSATYIFAQWYNGSSIQWAKIPVNQTEFTAQTGYYVGSGADNLAITGVGFQPDLVMVKDDSGNGNDGVNFKTSVMTGEASAVFADTDADTASDAIQSLDTDGFTLGTDLDVNTANIRFTWTAIDGSDCSETGTFCVGSYTGDGQSTKSVTSVGFKPDLVIVKSSAAQYGVYKTTSMPTNTAQYFASVNQVTDGSLIRTLDSTGFTVGNATQVNTNTTNYWYIAIKTTPGIFEEGTFTGNGTGDRAITGLGFEPDSVWIKNADATTPINAYYNNTDSYGDYSTAVTDVGNQNDVIKLLDADGFTVGTNAAANESGKLIYWFALGGASNGSGTGSFEMDVGTYTGNGTSQSITGLGFAPDLVIIRDQSGANYTVYRTRLMKGDNTSYFTVTDPFFAGGITSLDSDGFSVGSDANVNTNAVTYHYQAFGNAYNPETNSGSNDFVLGSYTGSGTDSRDITRLPFEPDLVAIKRNSSTDTIWRSSAMAGDITTEFGSSGDAADMIQAINPDGFELGTVTKANGEGGMFYFFAFAEGSNMKVGSYTGNDTSQSITAPGIQPDLVWVKSYTTNTGVHRPSTIAGDSTLYFDSTLPQSDRITSLTSTGFNVGSAGTVNGLDDIYRYAVWKIPSSNTAPDSPTSLAQLTTGDVTISTGAWHNSTSVKFTASADDTDASDTLYLCVEKDDINTDFSGTEDSCGSGVAFSGTPVTVNVTISSQTDATQYHWRARIKDAAGAYSSWVSYGANSDTTPGADVDYGLDSTAPTGGVVYDGTSAGVDVSMSDNSLSTLSANWDSFNFNVSGINKYEYSIGTTVGGTDIKAWTDNSTTTSVTATSLNLQSSILYYTNVRATDNAGNVSSVISSNGQMVAPSISFSVTPLPVTFANLSATNSYSDTKNTTLTTSTNAYNGYVIRAFVSDYLRSGDGATTIPDFNGGTYASPGTWSGSETGLGYTSSDTTIGGVDKFAGATLYAPFNHTGPGDIVADHTTNVSGTPVSNEVFTLTYKVTTPSSQAAKRYSNTVILTATAQY